jgi:hypothetical protein
MWGKICYTRCEINLINTAGVRRTKCGVKCNVRPAVGLSQIFEINLINTAGVRRTKCGVKCNVRPAVGLRQISEPMLIL